jgi:RecJ-like exonuclease
MKMSETTIVKEWKEVDQENALPALEIMCGHCRGNGQIERSGRCDFCNGAGYIPTISGMAILALFSHQAMRGISWRNADE